jgi:Tfp pilus assembly protein PilF
VPTQTLQAWEAYQLGKRRLTRRTTADLVDAEQFFRQAIGLDPKFALAYVGLATPYLFKSPIAVHRVRSPTATSEMAVAEALKLDANLAEAWASSGGVAQDRWQFDRAEAMFRRAIELNPNYATARHWYSMMLRDVGRADEAFAQIQRAVELDPLSAVITETLGEIQESHGRFPRAEVAYRRAITIDPSRPAPYLGLALLNAYGLDHVADAIPLVQKARGN